MSRAAKRESAVGDRGVAINADVELDGPIGAVEISPWRNAFPCSAIAAAPARLT
jgi:hypothetical protein